ncbi:dermonecrotic toxin domain-containing protein [Pseudomonas sp. RHF3.3-3]|uniref:dermonecrotic toxin domain-containing protein n=1 Tax=Pseudomonas sp. RHF3.3-3 TaxID=3396624 RepID=UPI003A83CB58
MPRTPQAPAALPYGRFIWRRLPDWLKNTSAEQRADLREALLTCYQSATRAAEFLAPLMSLDAFAEPILELDLKADHPELHDMQRATLDKTWHRDSFLWQPIYDASPEHSLLEAALLNFEDWETRSTAFGSGSAIYLTGKAKGVKSSLRPEVFARRCRHLDLGGKYLQHLRQTLDDSSEANKPRPSGEKHQLFIDHQRNRFNAELQMAYLSGHLSLECTKALKVFLLPRNQTFGKRLLCHRVRLLGQVLPGVIHFAADPENDRGRCAVYFPGHPEYPLQEYSSLLMFQVALVAHLKTARTRQRISQLLPIDHQEPLLREKLKTALHASSEAHIHIVDLSSWIEVELFEEIHRLRLLHLMSDLGRLAPSAEDVKAAEREKLLDEFQLAGLNLLSSLKDSIPRFKRTLSDPLDMIDTNLVYQDIHTWSKAQRQAGALHLLNIIEARAGGQVTPAMHREARSLPDLIPVRAHGHTRLWNPDPSHYRVALRLPDGQWQTNALGLHEWTNKYYLLLNDTYYEVRYNDASGHWHIVSPTQPTLYSPPLLHNGVGAWRTIHEDTRQWPKSTLLARLSPRAAQLPRPLADALLLLGHVSLETLQQLHRHSRRASPQLLDSLKRLWIVKEIEGSSLDRGSDSHCAELCSAIRSLLVQLLPDAPAQTSLRIRKQKSRKFIQYPKGSQWIEVDEIQWMPELFDQLYRQLEQPDTSQQQRLRVLYPELPLSFLQDLDFTLALLEQSQPTLPCLAREIERALEQLHVSRVFEGLHPDWPHARHSEHLAFSLFETLAGWPADMRLEFMEAEAARCTPIQGIGTDSSLNYRRLLKRNALYEIQDRQGKTLASEPDFYKALWQALPTRAQRDLGRRNEISLEEDQTTTDLKRALFRQATRLRDQVPAVRALQRFPEPPMSASAAPLPVQFAVPGRVVSGLQPGDDGVYRNLNRRPLSNHAHPYYILERHRYYPVAWTPEGWRLLNASNPYGFYQPLLQRRSRSNPRWTLHDPDHKHRLLDKAQRLPVPTANDSADEPAQNSLFTQAQHKRLETPKSYRTQLNSPLTYDRIDNARYPLRDLDGQALTVIALHYSSTPGSAQSQARAQQLLPYLAQGIEVARLYERKLGIRRFKAQHMRSADEQHLVGRFHVTARRDLASGELLGVYGGMLIPLIVCQHRLDPFATWVQYERSLELIRFRDGQPRTALPCLSGDNILSRINTIFEYEDGVPARQARSGYNVEAVAFPVDIRTHDGCIEKDRYFLTALFTSQTVKADEELRLNHGYSDEQIRTLNSAEAPQAQGLASPPDDLDVEPGSMHTYRSPG